jgi:hypothetical protein
MKKSVRPITALSALFTMVLLVLQAESASAMLRQCRGDPKFFFSDKTKLTVVVEMDTEEANVQKIEYVLHVPHDAELKHVVFTAGGLGEEETYEIFYDNPPDLYTIDTYVVTSVTSVNVTTTSSLKGGSSASASGFDMEHLVVEVQKP